MSGFKYEGAKYIKEVKDWMHKVYFSHGIIWVSHFNHVGAIITYYFFSYTFNLRITFSLYTHGDEILIIREHDDEEQLILDWLMYSIIAIIFPCCLLFPWFVQLLWTAN